MNFAITAISMIVLIYVTMMLYLMLFSMVLNEISHLDGSHCHIFTKPLISIVDFAVYLFQFTLIPPATFTLPAIWVSF
jgi:hypothetical protein